MTTKAKHAFGSELNIQNALNEGKINAYDILFLDEKKVGWIDKNGEVVIAEGGKCIEHVDALPTENGDDNVIYIFENEAYIWDGTTCIPLAQDADLTDLQSQINTKVDADTVQTMIDESVTNVVEVVEF